MYKFLLSIFGYEEYRLLDIEQVHTFGKKFGACSVYVGTKENWDTTRELAYRRGKLNEDFTHMVSLVETPIIRVYHNGHMLLEYSSYITGTRKKQK